MSEVEIYWSRIAAKAGDSRTWHDLNPIEQQHVLGSINALLRVLSGSLSHD
jgi:hypothetical protein